MKKQHRTLIVVVVAVLTASIASLVMYRAIQRLGVREVEVAHTQVVVAAQTITMGTRLHENHLRVVDWPSRNPVQGAFADPKKLIDRGVIVPIAENEPITESKVASLEAGAGLPPVIPEGMRAISVKVNEVIGVAGFVVPGSTVDVLVTVRTNNEEPMTRTVVSKVEVLTAGTRYDQEKSKDGEPISTSVVTLAKTGLSKENWKLPPWIRSSRMSCSIVSGVCSVRFSAGIGVESAKRAKKRTSDVFVVIGK